MTLGSRCAGACRRASLQDRNGSFRVLFYWHKKLHAFKVGKVARDEAESKAAQVNYLLMRRAVMDRLQHGLVDRPGHGSVSA